MSTPDQIADIFKAEYSNLIAVLCHHYKLPSIQKAEDVVSDTFMKAMRTWSAHGIPQNPRAWLRKTAVNHYIDSYRREKNYKEKVLPQITEGQESIEIEIDAAVINDSLLKMIFAVCDPEISIESSICMALRILCGFSIDEIAVALLSTKDSVNKKLYRAKQKLSNRGFESRIREDEFSNRLDRVLRILYLLFNEGYYSSISDQEIRSELCWEAMRLVLLLSGTEEYALPKVHALLALMCFHASRFEARIDEQGENILYADQDRRQWDHRLIQKGEYYLNKSSQGDRVSQYHIEASIAYWHTTDVTDKWENILQLYNKLLTIQYSPIVALNRTYAYAQVKGAHAGLSEAIKLDLVDNHLYHSLLAELYKTMGDHRQENIHIDKAIVLARKENEIKLLKERKRRALEKGK